MRRAIALLFVALATCVSSGRGTGLAAENAPPAYPNRNEKISQPARTVDLPMGQQLVGETFACSTRASGRCTVEEFISDAGICAVLVIIDGQIRFESFGKNSLACGNDPNQPVTDTDPRRKLYGLASVTKSVLSILVGLAIADTYNVRRTEDFLQIVDRPLGALVPEVAGTAYRDVPLKAALAMRSGIRWRQTWLENDDKAFGQVRDKRKSIVEFAQGYTKTDAAPGKRFTYMGLDPNLAGLAAARMLDSRLTRYIEQRFWPAIGAESEASWGIDRDGVAITDCCTKMTLRDLARVGMLVLRQGIGAWGQRVIPKAWFEISLSGFVHVPDDLADQLPGCPVSYGYLWWRRDKQSDFTGIGIGGQFLHIYPAERAVVVQIADWRTWRNDWACDSFAMHDALVQVRN